MTGPERRKMPGPRSGRYDRADLMFLDFEASGLEAGSWPIQIGIARVQDDDTVSIHEELIRPHPTWPEKLWSPVSAQVHGIPRSALDAAAEAHQVATRVIDLLAGRTLVSDAPEFDERWLHMLTATVDPSLSLVVEDFDSVLAASCGMDGIRRAYAKLDELPAPHQAGADAARLAHAWLSAVRR